MPTRRLDGEEQRLQPFALPVMLGQVAAAGPQVPNMSRKSSQQVLSPLIPLPIFTLTS